MLVFLYHISAEKDSQELSEELSFSDSNSEETDKSPQSMAD